MLTGDGNADYAKIWRGIPSEQREVLTDRPLSKQESTDGARDGAAVR
jgi:hypothetical protein